MAGGGPKPAFYIVVGLVVLGLIGLAVMRFDKSSEPSADKSPIVLPGTNADEPIQPTEAEAADDSSVTTAKEYNYVPAQKLPEVKGVSNYKAMSERTVRFAINVWAGWAPIVFANEGFKPKKVWQAPGGAPFKIELVLIDDPVAMRDAFAAGDIHIGWATVDMLPLLLEGLQKDSRVMPRVYQQIDWSNGGDGIVVRDTIKTMSDLRGKTIVLAQNSPSHFFILNALINAGVQPSEVKFKFTQDAFQAAAAFNADKSIAGCVSWAPDIYKLSEVKGNKLIVSTATANKLIADVWFARADFAKDHPDVIEGMVRGMFDAMTALKSDESKKSVAKWMSAGYSIPEADTLGMLADAHSTNYAENKDFFLNQNSPTNFERTYESASYLYRRIGTAEKHIAFDQIVDFSVLQKLAADPVYASQQDEYQINFAPRSASSIQAESDEILTKTVVIQFYPNSHDVSKMVSRDVNGKLLEVLYDPNVPTVVEEVGKLAGQYGAARIVVEGHTDASMKGRIPPEPVKELALARANAVKSALLQKFKTLQPNQLAVSGMGWDRPADLSDPMNNAKNRRVEIKVYPLEAPPAE